MRGILLLIVAVAYLFPTIAGWAFLVRSQAISGWMSCLIVKRMANFELYTEGASATFEITDDGGGFTFPYTMTVLKRVSNSDDEQVGLVLTNGNETTFYWICNQPAGTFVRFKLMSGAQVNAATSDYYEIQPSSQATAFSLSSLSVQSTSSLYAKTQTTQGSSTTTAPRSTATEPLSASSTRTPIGAIVGAIIGGVLLLAVLGLAVFWMRRHKISNGSTQGMLQYGPDPYVTPFTHGQLAQTIIPPVGYVSQSNFEEEPPVYSPHNTDTTTYFTGSESGRTESVYRPPPRSRGKSQYLPVSTQSN